MESPTTPMIERLDGLLCRQLPQPTFAEAELAALRLAFRQRAVPRRGLDIHHRHLDQLHDGRAASGRTAKDGLAYAKKPSKEALSN
jgi:hypothetical protein